MPIEQSIETVSQKFQSTIVAEQNIVLIPIKHFPNIIADRVKTLF